MISSSTITETSSGNSTSTLSADPDYFVLVAQVFFAAISIYLSGVFDYEITHWQTLGIVVSTLSEEEVQGHVKTILELGEVLLKMSNVSPVLLLFPLRVAGARSFHEWQQVWIIKLLEEVEVTYSVAAVFKIDLWKLWRGRATISSGLEGQNKMENVRMRASVVP